MDPPLRQPPRHPPQPLQRRASGACRRQDLPTHRVHHHATRRLHLDPRQRAKKASTSASPPALVSSSDSRPKRLHDQLERALDPACLLPREPPVLEQRRELLLRYRQQRGRPTAPSIAAQPKQGVCRCVCRVSGMKTSSSMGSALLPKSLVPCAVSSAGHHGLHHGRVGGHHRRAGTVPPAGAWSRPRGALVSWQPARSGGGG